MTVIPQVPQNCRTPSKYLNIALINVSDMFTFLFIINIELYREVICIEV